MSETFIGKQATLMKAIAKAREVRKLKVKELEMLDELIESLHASVRQEMRKEHAAALAQQEDAMLDEQRVAIERASLEDER